MPNRLHHLFVLRKSKILAAHPEMKIISGMLHHEFLAGKKRSGINMRWKKLRQSVYISPDFSCFLNPLSFVYL